MNWCDAQASCATIGGRLLTTLSTLVAFQQTFPKQTSADRFWVGYTDLATRVGTSRVGWWGTDGAQLPGNTPVWAGTQPGNWGPLTDCGLLASSSGQPRLTLMNGLCSTGYGFICEPGQHAFASKGAFVRTNFARRNLPVFYCYADRPAAGTAFYGRARCARLCADSPVCRGFLFSSVGGQCRQLLYTDALVEFATEVGAGWTKYLR